MSGKIGLTLRVLLACHFAAIVVVHAMWRFNDDFWRLRDEASLAFVIAVALVVACTRRLRVPASSDWIWGSLLFVAVGVGWEFLRLMLAPWLPRSVDWLGFFNTGAFVRGAHAFLGGIAVWAGSAWLMIAAGVLTGTMVGYAADKLRRWASGMRSTR